MKSLTSPCREAILRGSTKNAAPAWRAAPPPALPARDDAVAISLAPILEHAVGVARKPGVPLSAGSAPPECVLCCFRSK